MSELNTPSAETNGLVVRQTLAKAFSMYVLYNPWTRLSIAHDHLATDWDDVIHGQEYWHDGEKMKPTAMREATSMKVILKLSDYLFHGSDPRIINTLEEDGLGKRTFTAIGDAGLYPLQPVITSLRDDALRFLVHGHHDNEQLQPLVHVMERRGTVSMVAAEMDNTLKAIESNSTQNLTRRLGDVTISADGTISTPVEYEVPLAPMHAIDVPFYRQSIDAHGGAHAYLLAYLEDIGTLSKTNES